MQGNPHLWVSGSEHKSRRCWLQSIMKAASRALHERKLSWMGGTPGIPNTAARSSRVMACASVTTPLRLKPSPSSYRRIASARPPDNPKTQ